MKKKFILSLLSVAVIFMTAAAGVWASNVSAGPSASEALKLLQEGNRRYVAGQMTAPAHSSAAARTALAKSQKPYAIVVCCSDSRVPPEIVFDKGLGEIFVVRVACNILDEVALGSVEYGAEHLGCPLVMVLGHERCGAVTATVNADGQGEGNIGAIIAKIAPALQEAKLDCKEEPSGRTEVFIECVSDANIRRVVSALTKDSEIIRHLAAEKKLAIVGAKYDLDDGKVTLIK